MNIHMKSRFIILDDKHSHSRLQMKPYIFLRLDKGCYSNGKCEYPWESTLNVCHHVPIVHTGYIGPSGEYLGNKLLGYSPKGTHIFPLVGADVFVTALRKKVVLIRLSDVLQHDVAILYRWISPHGNDPLPYFRHIHVGERRLLFNGSATSD